MSKSIHLGHLGGLAISAHPSAVIGFILLWAFLGALGFFVLHLPLLPTLFGSFIGTLLHYVSELWHNLGHALAARSTGYPMAGVSFWGVLAASRYPGTEGLLPSKIHIQRALGGPIASAFLALLFIILLSTQSAGDYSLSFWLILFLFLDNLLVFTIGSLLPLGFTDGSTLLQWWGKP